MKNRASLTLYLHWPIAFALLTVVMNLVMAAFSLPAARLMLVYTVLVIVLTVLLWTYSRRHLYEGLSRFSEGFATVQSRLMESMDTAAVLTDRKGSILWTNAAFRELASAQHARVDHIQGLFPDITKDILSVGDEAVLIHSGFGDRKYRLEMRTTLLADDGKGAAEDMPEEASISALAFFITDETELTQMQKEFDDAKLCEGLIYLDNYDEVMETVEEVRRSLLSALVDRKISNYISSMNGVVKKLEKDKYFFILTYRDAEKLMEDRFSVLEEVKTINIGNELSVTLSIGVGMDGISFQDKYDQSRASIDLALGRGGDQAVVRVNGETRYFGGKTLAVEKNTRVKARVKAHAFRELLENKDKVIVMGHRIGDVDSFGASVGIWTIAEQMGKKAYILTGQMDRTVQPVLNRFLESESYEKEMFVNGDEALSLVDDSTVLVVVDVNRPSFTEEPRLLDACRTVVLIDHHRKGSETIGKAVLSYVEPYASSACEMVTEIIQYISDDIKLMPQEADALYSGMVIDTQNFTASTGVRTFEAAAYLRRSGADIIRVRKMFRENYRDYKAKAEAVDRAEIYRDSFAISVCDPKGTESPTVVGAQAANNLLQIRGIKAAIVLTDYAGKIFISARSIDEVNVQVMMEKLGGGGHKNMAGTQLEGATLEEARAKVLAAIDTMIKEGEVS